MVDMLDVDEFDPNISAPVIKDFEGLRLTAYQCTSGVLTIGYGHTKNVKKGESITTEEANLLLSEDLADTFKDLQKLVKVPLTRGMFIALMSFVFNFGLTKCKTYSLFTVLNKGDYLACSEKFPDYCKGTNSSGQKVTIQGLLNRRLKEQALFNSDGLP